MTDLDMLYDYYTSVNLASGGYATIACRIKDDKTEKLFRDFAKKAMFESQMAAKMVIKHGGHIY